MTLANLSGGRDSTAMVVKWLESGKDLDYIIFCNTGFEFPAMYSYISKLDNYLKKHFNKQITIIQNGNTMEKWAFEKPISKGKDEGRKRGLPKVVGKDYCTRELKIKPTRDFVLSKSPNKFKNTALISYTYNEVENGRVSNLEYAISCYPLHEWKMNEPEVTEFLKERGIMNPLYNDFSRTGCFFCPKQSLRSFYTLFKKYPQEWEFMKKWEKHASDLNCVNTTWHRDFKLTELEERFKKEGVEREQELFNNDYAESETCFCR